MKRFSTVRFFFKILLIGVIPWGAMATEINSAEVWQSYSQAWIYPGEPACNAPETFLKEKIQTLKPEYFALTTAGTLRQLTVSNAGCNGYSKANIESIKAHSVFQFITVSGELAQMRALVTNDAKMEKAIKTLTDFVKTHEITGIELDLEEFWSWTKEDYLNFLTFVSNLGNALHQIGGKLMIDGPALSKADQYDLPWDYADFETLPVDYLVIMAYDFQYRVGGGAALAPLSWVVETANWAKSKISDINRLVLGIPAYGYHSHVGDYDFHNDTYEQSSGYPNFHTATRDPQSFEMMWEVGNVFYSYVDSEGLNSKRAAIENLTQIPNISVWHLGGNKWFTQKREPRKR